VAKKKGSDLDLKFKKIYAKAMIENRELPIKTKNTKEPFFIKDLKEDTKGDNTHICRLISHDKVIIPARSTSLLNAVIATFNHLEDMGKNLDYGQ
jgi:hypothetical protein|tara:strand:- start:866 stop:1150 length:285 start_codon:yes stop_codon:yes gene_type:complete